MRISHQGIGTGRGLAFALAAALKQPVGQAAAFPHYQKFATRTATQGEVALAAKGERAVGLFVDVSPKGDSCTVETAGFEWVPMDTMVGVAPKSFVTVGDDGLATLIEGAIPTMAEAVAGCWEVDAVDAATGRVLIDLEARI